ncbi:hypothetical protein GCM10009682_57800 [Luedemannella flava]|uniref:Uncharacterized protein n=1 Tax=Luedemannella flava TaxID=349316 RepID=A0ABN2MN70_9ACTN
MTGRPRPALRTLVTAGGRLLLSQNDEPVLLAKVWNDHGLLWWLSALDSYVILDGHDRIVAAVAEDVEPPLMALARAAPRRAAEDTRLVVDRFVAQQPLLPEAGQAVADRSLARTLTGIETDYHRSRAWSLPGGPAAWDAIARAHSVAWAQDIAWLVALERRPVR